MATLSYTAAQIDAALAKADTAVQPETTGDLDNLATSTKTNLVAAINETFTSVSSGKTLIAAAITDKGVTTAATDSFSTMATNIAAIPSGGGSSYTKIASQDFTADTTSTSTNSLGTMSLGSTGWTSAKILYIRIRDKAGARNGYFVGSENYIFNTSAANNTTTAITNFARVNVVKGSSGNYTLGTGGYGVFVSRLGSDGTLTISTRYNSTNSLTINGTYNVTVYALDYAPDQGNPFDYSFS